RIFFYNELDWKRGRIRLCSFQSRQQPLSKWATPAGGERTGRIDAGWAKRRSDLAERLAPDRLHRAVEHGSSVPTREPFGLRSWLHRCEGTPLDVRQSRSECQSTPNPRFGSRAVRSR